MAKKYKVTVRGTVQLNGPISVNKSFITDDFRLASSFTGGDRYRVMEEWLRVNYPGAKIMNIRGFAANVTSFEEKEPGEEKKTGFRFKFW